MQRVELLSILAVSAKPMSVKDLIGVLRISGSIKQDTEMVATRESLYSTFRRAIKEGYVGRKRNIAQRWHPYEYYLTDEGLRLLASKNLDLVKKIAESLSSD